MNFLDNYHDKIALKMKSKKARHEFYVAIIEYYYEGIEPTFKNESADVAFEAIRYSLDKARAGRLGGQAKPQANSQANAEAKPQAESKKRPKPGIGKGIGIEETSPNGEVKNEFPLQCLDAFNLEFGSCYSTLPNVNWMHLERMGTNYSLDDVITMLRYKHEEWQGTKYQSNLTPKTLFSPDHFEQYVHQSKMPKAKEDKIDAILAEYDPGF